METQGKSKERRWRRLIVLICSVSVAGCGLKQSKQGAENVLARHFQTIATNGYEEAIQDYGPEFFQRTGRTEWTSALARFNSRLGSYQSHTVSQWRVFKAIKSRGGGTTVLLQCQVSYSKYSA